MVAMKYKYLFIPLLLAVLLTGCRTENVREESGSGWLAVDFLMDKSLQTRGGEPIYRLTIEKADGSLIASYEDCSTITDRILLKAGDYKLIASNGSDTVAEFEMPFYQCMQEVKIETGVTKDISMVCTQANVKVTVDYSALIKERFSDYSFEVTNGAGMLLYKKDEDRAGYLRVNDGTMVWNLTLNNGQERFLVTKTITGVAPRQHYRFQFDIRENGSEDEGAFIPGIVVDTTTDVFNWICDIVLKDSIAKPVIQGDGFNLNETVLVLDEARGVTAKVDVTALAKIQELKLRHHSAAVTALGVPEVVTLSNISPTVKAAVNSAGIIWGDNDVLDAQQVGINFSGILDRLPLGEYQFFISVYDARKRLVEDTLKVSVIPDMEHVADEVSVPEVWATFATVKGRWYTTVRPAALELEYSVDQVNWTSASDLKFSDSDKTFVGSLNGLNPNTGYYFRTKSETWTSDIVRQFKTEVTNQVPFMNFDDWYMDGKSPVAGLSKDNIIWDSGNKGGAGFGFTPTTEEKSLVVNGSAARLESQYAAVKFAAGNIYTGSFGGVHSVTQARINFGIPYQGRPTTLSGWYKYNPKVVNRGNYANMSGKLDSCHIYIALLDWTAPFVADSKTETYVDLSVNNKSIIGFGELVDCRQMNTYEKFDVKINYRDKIRKPSYILIVASASKFGDYFTGGEGSLLLIDEFSLGFDAPKE